MIQHRMKNKMATANTSSLLSSIPKRAAVTQGCYNIDFESMRMRTMRGESENPRPQLMRPSVESGHAERLSTVCWRRLGCSEFSVRPKYRKKMFGTKLVNDLHGKMSCPGEAWKGQATPGGHEPSVIVQIGGARAGARCAVSPAVPPTGKGSH